METLEPFNIIYQTAEDGLGDTVKPRLMEADADLEKVLVIDDRDTPLTLADERIARAIPENNARLVIIDPVQAFLGADVDMNRANEVRPIFRSLGDIAQATGCAIVLIGHLNKAAGTQSTYRGLGSIDITAAVRSPPRFVLWMQKKFQIGAKKPAGLGPCRFLRPGMGFLIHVLQLVFDHMGVDLGGGDVRVAQHFLDGPEVRAVFQQVRRKGVAQGVGRDEIGRAHV